MCGDLEIDVQFFLSSTPSKFNAYLRGRYQKIEREGGWAMMAGTFAKPMTLDKFLGFQTITAEKAWERYQRARGDLDMSDKVSRETAKEDFHDLLNEFGVDSMLKD